MKTGLFNGGPETSPFLQGNFSFAHEWLLQEVGMLDELLAQLGARIGRAASQWLRSILSVSHLLGGHPPYEFSS